MQDGVRRSEAFVCILSEGYFESEYCCKEMAWAFAANKIVISTYKAGCNVGAILRQAPEALRSLISGIESIQLVVSDPDFFSVSLKKIGDASKVPVADQLREALVRNAVRVIDLFREWDVNDDGLVSKAEFREAMPALGLRAPSHVVDEVFDSFDNDGETLPPVHRRASTALRVHVQLWPLPRRWRHDRVP